ncbi:hypothetical protein EYV94_09590 [Puteibacter caeruleilacunae]|nr:hypothetical protein EYV94_09590 [Puteibacter caeruleilacunae]
MHNQFLIYQHLKKICDSKTFSKSVVNKQLLRYLVDQTLQGETPKEIDITYNVFGKHEVSEKGKNVRSYILNLRKKLDEYYSIEGKNDVLKLLIPKGNYSIQFKIDKKALFKEKTAKYSPAILLISIIILIISSVLFFKGQRRTSENVYFWKDIEHSDFPTTIVLGDHYFFRKTDVLNQSAVIRINDINSDEQFAELQSKHPEAQHTLEQLDHSYINIHAPVGLFKVMNMIKHGNPQLDLLFSSNIRWQDLKDRNVIFIGSYKTQKILKEFHQKIGIDYQVSKATLHYQVNDTTISLKRVFQEDLRTEPASFSFVKTTDGRIILSFMCDTGMVNIALLNYITDPNNLARLEEQMATSNSSSFKALFQVTGNQQTDFEIKLRRIDKITVNVDEIWP